MGLSRGLKKSEVRRGQHLEEARSSKPRRWGRGMRKERRKGSELLKVIVKRKRTPLGASDPPLAAAPYSQCGMRASEGRKRGVP